MKKSLILSILIFPISGFSQKYDTVLHGASYQSYVSFNLRSPVFVSYKLYKGGGQCSRKGMRFKNDTEILLAGDFSYKKSGFDRGHLLSAEDRAYDCKMMENTFRYYNCIPQRPVLNRGEWKSWEIKIRELSQTDSLFIITGGIWKKKQKTQKGMFFPDYCWKLVYSLEKKKILHALLFTNSNFPVFKETSVQEIEGMMDCKLPTPF